MSLRSLQDDPARLDALVDILCAAASADEYIASQEIAVVEATVRDAVGLGDVPESVRARIAAFDPTTYDVNDAIARLAPADDAEREAVLAAAVAVVAADRFVDSGEYGFISELAAYLGLPVPTKFK